MRRLVFVSLAGCGRVSFDALADGSSVVVDAPCTLSPFGSPIRLAGPINSSDDDWGGTPSRGGLDLVMGSYRTGAQSSAVWEARRLSVDDLFDTPVPITELDTAGADDQPAITEDALTIVFWRTSDLYQAQRPSLTQPFGSAVPLSINSGNGEEGPWLAPDGLRLIFSSSRGAVGGLDLYETTRTSLTAPFAAPRELRELDSNVDEQSGSLSPDGLEIFFSSRRPATGADVGGSDIYTARRPAIDLPFEPPVLVPQLSSALDDVSPKLAADGLTLYLNFNTLTSGGANADIWVSTRTCE